VRSKTSLPATCSVVSCQINSDADLSFVTGEVLQGPYRGRRVLSKRQLGRRPIRFLLPGCNQIVELACGVAPRFENYPAKTVRNTRRSGHPVRRPRPRTGAKADQHQIA
jgi:hypothetical protein